MATKNVGITEAQLKLILKQAFAEQDEKIDIKIKAAVTEIDEQGQRNVGALAEHHSHEIKGVVEVLMMNIERMDREYAEYQAYTERQDKINAETWFRVSRIEKEIFDNEEKEV